MKKFQKYLIAEIGIEFKACLYFFAILFFYCVYRMLNGSFEAKMLDMAEMILTTYIMGYIQVFLLRNFEESEKLGAFEWAASIGCSVFYGIESYVLGWFDRNLMASLIYTAYMLLCYICIIIIYYVRRQADTESLNQDLTAFKKRGGEG